MNSAFRFIILFFTAVLSDAFFLTAHAADQQPIRLKSQTMVAEGDLVLQPCGAFGAGVYMVVWQQGWAGVDATADVMGVRLEPGTLRVLDSEPLPIAVAPEAQFAPAVAFGTDAFLVTWQDFRNKKDLDIRATLLDAKSGRTKGPEIRVATRSHNQARPAVAWTGTHFLIVWQEASPNGHYGIAGARVSATGEVLDKDPLRFAETGNQPTVTASGGKVLVTWNEGKGRTSAALVNGKTGALENLLGGKNGISSRCGMGTSVAHDGQGNFMTVAAREPFPNPWGWPGPGCVLFSRVQSDGTTPEAELNYGYRLSNICARSVPNVIDTATWGKTNKWHAGAPGGFKGTADGLWPRGMPAVACSNSEYLFAWVKGRILPDRLNLAQFDIWVRGLSGKELRVSLKDQVLAGEADVDELQPALISGPDKEAVMLWLQIKPNEKKRIMAAELTR